MIAKIDLNGPIDFSNPETYVYLFICFVVVPFVVALILAILAALHDNFW